MSMNFWQKVKNAIPQTAPVRLVDRLFERYPLYMRYRHRGLKFETTSIVLITLDSLRYDTAQLARTPNFDRLFAEYGSQGWVLTGAHGTYTLPAHVSMLHAGIMACDNRPEVPAPFNRDKGRIFKAQLAWERTTGAMFPTPAAPNIVKGFEALNYRTIGVGGVHWFDTRFVTSRFWKDDYFQEFYWNDTFCEKDPRSFENQIAAIRTLGLRTCGKPIFLFLNVSSTHTPYMGFEPTVAGQAKALEYVDSHLPELLELLPDRCDLMILADHGECFGEEGLWGHSFYHPRVMEVPFAYIKGFKDPDRTKQA